VTKLEEHVVAVAARVRKRFVRRWRRADPDDAAQDAAVGALVAVRSGRLDLRKNVRGYLFTAGRTEAELAASYAISVVTLSEHEAATNASAHGRRVVRNEDGEEVVDLLPGGFPSPLEALERRREAAAALARKIRRDRLVEARLRELDATDARVVSILLGVGGEEAAAGGIDEVAFRTGLGRARVLQAVRRLKVRVAGDRELRQAQERVTTESTA